MERDKETNGNEEVGSCMCETMPKNAVWDEDRWRKHWANQKTGHKERLDRLHKEARKIHGKIR